MNSTQMSTTGRKAMARAQLQGRPANRNTQPVSFGRHRITYLDDVDVEVVLRAQLGQSTKFIQAQTGLTPSQITYRLVKAARAQGFKPRDGYRTQWRNGTSPVAQRIFHDFAPELHRQLHDTLPRHFIQPRPQPQA